MSRKLFRLLAVFIIVMILSAGLYKSLLSNSGDSWEKVGFENIKASMQEGLAEMHWQWQYEGRPESIIYEMSGKQSVQAIAMNAKGWPALAESEEACSLFLNMFAGTVVVEVSFLEMEVNVEQQLGINIEFLKQQEANDLGGKVDICRYRRLDQQFEYQLGTGNLF